MDSSWARGIDVSHFQGTIDWPAVAASGIVFAVIKATDGVEFSDPLFEANWRGSKAAGLKRAAYHFWRPATDPEAQISRFLARALPDPGELPEALDVESTPARTLVPSDVGNLAACLDLIDTDAGRRPMIYTSAGQWHALGNPSQFGQHPLWIARYAADPGVLPSGFARWHFWQHTQTGVVPGINAAVDLDVFSGTPAELAQRFAFAPFMPIDPAIGDAA